ncbi:Ig-like domain-containing protein [Aneurinibacillus aneurinilyticus]|uniref:Ig-like domain-containing protein n=1 Tax=Aneurinibacillus aneurinilyticus TaxID=1391 RepID=UPI003523320F
MPKINYFNQDDNVEFQFILDDAGTDVKINGLEQRVLITNTNIQTNNDDKKISSIEPLKRGDLVDYTERRWLIINEVNGLRYDTYKAVMRYCNYTIKFSVDCKVYEFPCIIESSTIGVSYDSKMVLPNDLIKVTVQENTDTLKIKRDQRFIKLGSAWNVIGIDRTQQGLITFTCEIDQISVNDDLVNEIADKCNKTYTIEILNGANSSIDRNGTLQLNVKVTENGSVVTLPVVYESSDNTVATVDNNGLVSGVTTGIATITVSLVDDPSIQDSINIKVESVTFPNNYSVVIEGFNEIKKTVSTPSVATYTGKVLNNGVQDTSKSVIWEIVSTNEILAPKSTIQSQNGTSCVVQAGGTQGKAIVLRATYIGDLSIYAEKTITIKALF